MLVDVTSTGQEQARCHIDTITSALSRRTKAAKRADARYGPGRRIRSGPSDQTKPARAGAAEPERAIKPNRHGPGGGAGAGQQTKPARAGAAEPERAIKPASRNPDTPCAPYSGTLTGDTRFHQTEEGIGPESTMPIRMDK
jgi:hypothetical protein